MMDETLQVKPGALQGQWHSLLEPELSQPYMRQLREFLFQQKQAGKVIFPPGSKIFNAFNHTPFERVKVVILGQDPYHGPGQAHGLCFSVQPGVPVPPSLVNIFKEIRNDLGIEPPGHGCLTSWADQGVLLLNAVLTVEQGMANAHQGKGWEHFTDRAIALLNEQCEGIVFMLWGSYAQKKGQLINRQRHRVLTAPHPSPLSAHRGFLGCKHFSLANEYLLSRGQTPINWRLPDLPSS
ncbi:MAG: uracil-DNA glycosylase [Hahellaceae bacterium]|nr:uracil-DNA glycosylase [Hahellaceae bacterium]